MVHSKNNQMHEYFVLINPPNWIKWEVEDIKHDFADSHGQEMNETTKPHIPLTNFVQRHEREEKALKSLQKIASGLKSFDVSLAGFDFFDSNNTFCIDIKNKRPLKGLHDSLLSQLPLNDVPVDKTDDTFHASMTISKKLSDREYRDAFHEFSKKSYTNYFRVEYLTVLKREFRDAPWQYLTEIQLGE